MSNAPEQSKEITENLAQQNAKGSFTGENQHFSNIEKIYAKDGFVFIKVKKATQQDGSMGRVIKDGMLSIREAAARAKSLNGMAHKFPKNTRETAMEIVENVIAACKEAQIQAEAIVDKKAKPILRDTDGQPLTGAN